MSEFEAQARADDFASIAEHAPVPMWVTQLDRSRRYVNAAYCDFLGLDRERAKAFDWRSIVHPEDAEQLVAKSIEGEASLAPFTLEARYRRGDGEWRWLRSVSQPQLSAEGEHIGFIGVAHDITEAKRAEAALREREQQLSAFIEQSTAGFAQVDLTGRFTLVNDRYCEMVGRSRAQLLDLTMQQITHPDDLPRNEERFDAAVHQGTPYTHEKRCIRGDGSIIWVNNSVAPIRRPDGTLYGILAISIDVTARREAAEREQVQAERLAFVERLGEATAEAADADAVLAITTQMLGEHLGISDCAYADMDSDEDSFHIRGDWHRDDVPSIVGTYSLTSFGSRAVDLLHAGAPLVVNDNIEELGDDGAQAFLDIGIRTTICVPLVKGGRLTALMAVHDSQPRYWTDAELALTEEVTQRCWAHIERVRAQASLRATSERLELAISSAQMGIWDWDLVSGVGEWSDRTYEIMGVDPGTPVTAELRFALVHPDDRDAVRAGVERLRNDGARYIEEYRVVRPDGTVRWVSSNGLVLRDTAGAALRMTGTVRDVTTRRNALEALEALTRTLGDKVAERTAERDRMWRLSKDLLVVIDPRHCIQAVNPAVASLGYDPDEIVGSKFETYVHPDDLRVAAKAIRAAARAPVEQFAARVRSADGEWRNYALSAAPGETEAYIIGRDVTAQVQRDADLETARESLRQAQKVEALGQLTGGVAHDFNNLLTPILGSLDLLRRDTKGDKARRERWIDAALDAAGRARTLVQRLLAFARRQPLKSVPIDIAALLADLGGLVSSTFGPTIQLVVHAPAGLPPVLADANQLEMALLNLCVNARDAMPAGGTLTLSAGPVARFDPALSDLSDGEYVRVAVSDTGSGMDAETLARAIEPFFSTKGTGRGTGLGLSMVHGLASQLNGKLVISSTVDVGTTIELILPVAQGQQDEAGVAEQPVAKVASRRVLLVDDDDAARGAVREMLEALGFVVSEADSGGAGLALLSTNEFDHLVTDHLMPGMDGVELIAQARSSHPDLPVLIVSGYADLTDIPVDLPRLAKPFRIDELAAQFS